LRREEKEEAQPPSALDDLLAVDDLRRVGALRFREEDGVFRRVKEQGAGSSPPLVELGHLLSPSRAVEANKESSADLADLRGCRTSFGGMRPKGNPASVGQKPLRYQVLPGYHECPR
jgi:serine/threonine-protein kinase HipA